MEIRKSNLSDFEEILKVYESARQFMLENDNPDQWRDGYPDEEMIIKDIESNNHFVCVDNNRVIGCFTFMEGDDPTYKEIYEGKWLDNNPYGVIHKIAVLENGKGTGTSCLEYCFSRCKNIRIDTHRDNIPMQRLLEKRGFQYCGVIYNWLGDERLAYQRV